MIDPNKRTQDDNVDRFVQLHDIMDNRKAELSKLQKEKDSIKTVLAKQFGESGTVGVRRGGRNIHLQKFTTAAANDGLRPAMIEEMSKHEETEDLIKDGLHGGSFNSWVSGFNVTEMMTAEELHSALPKWLQPFLHVNMSTVAVAKSAAAQ